MLMDELPTTTTITPDSCHRGRRPKAGGLSSFWTARHYTILCFRHNLQPQIAIHRHKPAQQGSRKARQPPGQPCSRHRAALYPAAADSGRGARAAPSPAWRVSHTRVRRRASGTAAKRPENPRSYQETGAPAVNNLIDASYAVRIPAITGGVVRCDG